MLHFSLWVIQRKYDSIINQEATETKYIFCAVIRGSVDLAPSASKS